MDTKIISHFKEKPKARITWWSFGLGLAVIFSGPVLGISAAVFVPFLSKVTTDQTASIIGFSIGALMLILTIAALVTGIISFKKGERSWAMWFGLIPATLTVLMWIFLFAGELLLPH